MSESSSVALQISKYPPTFQQSTSASLKPSVSSFSVPQQSVQTASGIVPMMTALPVPPIWRRLTCLYSLEYSMMFSRISPRKTSGTSRSAPVTALFWAIISRYLVMNSLTSSRANIASRSCIGMERKIDLLFIIVLLLSCSSAAGAGVGSAGGSCALSSSSSSASIPLTLSSRPAISPFTSSCSASKAVISSSTADLSSSVSASSIMPASSASLVSNPAAFSRSAVSCLFSRSSSLRFISALSAILV